jgi:hypothetical protein
MSFEAPKDKVPSVEDCTILKYFDDVFKEILRFPLKRDIDLFIDMMPRVSPLSNTPYRMSTLELKELQIVKYQSYLNTITTQYIWNNIEKYTIYYIKPLG